MHGHPQVCVFASSLPSTPLSSYHVSSQTNKYFHLHDTLVPTKWLVLQTDDVIVSTKMQTLVIIGKPFYSRRKYVQ